MASVPRGKGVGGDVRRPASQDIPGARLTVSGVLLLLFYLGLPVAILGNLLDFLFQWWFGWCIGLWCIVN
jgi:hypothetical protein